MVFKMFCILVFWLKVAKELEGLNVVVISWAEILKLLFGTGIFEILAKTLYVTIFVCHLYL